MDTRYDLSGAPQYTYNSTQPYGAREDTRSLQQLQDEVFRAENDLQYYRRAAEASDKMNQELRAQIQAVEHMNASDEETRIRTAKEDIRRMMATMASLIDQASTSKESLRISGETAQHAAEERCAAREEAGRRRLGLIQQLKEATDELNSARRHLDGQMAALAQKNAELAAMRDHLQAELDETRRAQSTAAQLVGSLRCS